LVSVDPSKRKTGGALLGDRIRMNAIHNERVYMRSLATRQSNLALSKHVAEALNVLRAAEFDLIILETSGIGQSDTEIMEHSDIALYIMTPEFGAATQLEKIDMLDFADVVAINKSDKRGAQDALRDVRKQFKRNHDLWDAKEEELPIIGTIASQFNDPGTNFLYETLIKEIVRKTDAKFDVKGERGPTSQSEKAFIIPPARVRYLSEITDCIRSYDKWSIKQSDVAGRLQALQKAAQEFNSDEITKSSVSSKANELRLELDPKMLAWLEDWPALKARYKEDVFGYKVRGQEVRIPTKQISLSNNLISKVALPSFTGWNELAKYAAQENLPGTFPYTAGIYPFKRTGEDPTRMFAGEGGPERTNKRFHYVSLGMAAKRLSTAFDSVTLYGSDPDKRPDIYGKVGNAGVSICSLDDAKKLYSGFDLCSSATSVSMTINGPAPMVLAFFLNAAIDQTCEKYIKAHGLEGDVEKVLKAKWDDQGLDRPHYEGELPEASRKLHRFLPTHSQPNDREDR